MKKIIFLVVSIICIQTVIAGFEITTNKEIYSEKETVLFNVNADLKLVEDLKIGNLKLILPNGNEENVAGEIKKLNDEKYAGYFEVPLLNNYGKYKIRFGGLKYLENDELKSGDFEREIEVIDNKESILSVVPGVVVIKLESLDQPKLNFRIKNNGENLIDLSLGVVGDFLVLSKGNIKVQSNEIKYVDVNTKVRGDSRELFEGAFNIDYGNNSMSIPVYLTRGEIKISEPVIEENETESINETIELNETIQEAVNASIEFDFVRNKIDKIDVPIEKNFYSNVILYLKNTGDSELNDIKVSFEGNIKEIFEGYFQEGDKINPGEIGIINVTANPKKMELKKDYSGFIIVSSDQGASASMEVILHMQEQKVVLEEKPETEVSQPVVIQEPRQLIEEAKEESKKWILLVLIAVIIIIGAFIYVFYQKGEKQKKSFKSLISGKN